MPAPRDRHGAAAQLHEPLGAAVEGDAVGGPVPLPGAGAVGLHRAEERDGQRHEERRDDTCEHANLHTVMQ